MATLKNQGTEIVRVEYTHLLDGADHDTRLYSLRSNGRVLFRSGGVWRIMPIFRRSSDLRARAFIALLLARGACLIEPAAWPADLWLELTDHEGLISKLLRAGQRATSAELGEPFFQLARSLHEVTQASAPIKAAHITKELS
jgi:hypothetical protein